MTIVWVLTCIWLSNLSNWNTHLFEWEESWAAFWGLFVHHHDEESHGKFDSFHLRLWCSCQSSLWNSSTVLQSITKDSEQMFVCLLLERHSQHHASTTKGIVWHFVNDILGFICISIQFCWKCTCAADIWQWNDFCSNHWKAFSILPKSPRKIPDGFGDHDWWLFLFLEQPLIRAHALFSNIVSSCKFLMNFIKSFKWCPHSVIAKGKFVSILLPSKKSWSPSLIIWNQKHGSKSCIFDETDVILRSFKVDVQTKDVTKTQHSIFKTNQLQLLEDGKPHVATMNVVHKHRLTDDHWPGTLACFPLCHSHGQLLPRWEMTKTLWLWVLLPASENSASSGNLWLKVQSDQFVHTQSSQNTIKDSNCGDLGHFSLATEEMHCALGL